MNERDWTRETLFGEILVTLEKIKWLLRDGEKWLKPEKRSAGLMMFYKNARVEYHPVGVMGGAPARPCTHTTRIIRLDLRFQTR